MAVQAGVVGMAQVNAAPSTSPSQTSGMTAPSTWSWVWFIISLSYLVFTHLAAHSRRTR